eukprot:scaffold4408_cov130-Cylindrotheca_fusiformis.AAC.2
MDEIRNRTKRKSSEIEEAIVASNNCWFDYTIETDEFEDIPRTTMTHLRVHSSVSEIPDREFTGFRHGCKALVHVQLPETLKRIGEQAFFLCRELKYVQFVSNAHSLDTSSNPDLEDGTIVFPETLLQIESKAFIYCKRLRKVIVRSASTELGERVFLGCVGLISAELPEGLQVIEMGLFEDCTSLRTVKIPSSVIKIGPFAFSRCKSLTSVVLPHGLVEIGERCFSYCVSIETLDIPPTVSSIGKFAFAGCSGLKHIKLPPTLERIEHCMLQGCGQLEYIHIPSTVTFIGEDAFHKCACLSHIRIPPGVNRIEPATFRRCRSLLSVEVPEKISITRPCYDECKVGFFTVRNLAIPTVRDLLSWRKSKLFGTGAIDVSDPLCKLKHRFANSPLNRLCYYQSYFSSEDAMRQLCSLMEADPLAATSQVDAFGMTPLHVLSLSQTPNLDMFLSLMDAGNADHIIRRTDSFGCTPMDYLCLNRTPNSTLVIRKVLQTRFDFWLGPRSEGLKSDRMRQAVDEALEVELSSRRKVIGGVYFKLAQYEQRMKILSLLDLCLWKKMIDEDYNADRELCRINSRSSIVLPQVLPFLDISLDMEDFVPDHDQEDDEDSSMTSDSDDDSDNHEDGSIASFVRSD